MEMADEELKEGEGGKEDDDSPRNVIVQHVKVLRQFCQKRAISAGSVIEAKLLLLDA